MGRPTGAIIVAVIACVFLPMSLIALGARLWSRRMMKVKLCLNDYFAILATIFTTGVAVVFLTSFAAGLGLHLKDIPLKQLELHLKVRPAGFCIILLICAKNKKKKKFRASADGLAAFRARATSMGSRKLIICYSTMALTGCYFITVFLEAFLMCRPITYNWDKNVPGGHCGNENLAYLIAGITNLLLDTLVVALPMPMLWGLQIPLSKKFGLAAMFGLGSLICIISLQRVLWLQRWDLKDLTYTDAPGACWSTLEPTLGVVNACLPIMRPVLRKLFHSGIFSWSTKASSSDNHQHHAAGTPHHRHRRTFIISSRPSGPSTRSRTTTTSFSSELDRKRFQRLSSDPGYLLATLEANTTQSSSPASNTDGREVAFDDDNNDNNALRHISSGEDIQDATTRRTGPTIYV